MTTLRPCSSRWRRTRSTILAGTVAASVLLTPVGVAIAEGPDPSGSPGFTISTSETGDLSGLTAQVSADGDGLHLRAEPSSDAAIVSTLSDGTIVDLRIDMLDTVYDSLGTRWWPVAVNGDEGWLSGSYLVEPGATTNALVFKDVPVAASGSADESRSEPSAEQFVFGGGELADTTAVVSADDDNLLLRSEPSASATLVDRIPDGTVVDLRIDSVDTVYDDDGVTRWWPVTFDGQDGWVSGFYLSDGAEPSSTAGTDGTSGSTEPTPDDRVAFAWDGSELAGATAIVSNSNGSANIHGDPSAESDVVTTASNGTTVNLRIADVDTVIGPDGLTRWWPVEVDGATGWMSGFDLSDAGATPVDAEPDGPENSTAVFPSGSTAIVQTGSGDGLRVRADAGTDSEQITSLPEGSVVTIEGGPASFENSVNGWFEISTNEATGFVDVDLLILLSTPEPTPVPVTPTAVPTEAPTAEPTVESDPQDMPVFGMTPTAVPSGDETESPLDDRPTAIPTQTPVGDDDAAEMTPAPTQEPAGASFIVPVDGATRTQGFGCSSLGFYPYNPDWGCGVHDGVDYAAPQGTPLLASSSGTVVAAQWCDCGLGYYVEIDHGDGVHTIYGHMASQPYVSVGQQVAQGETIGPIGSTGLSTGPHVHFMVQVNGVSQDPAGYLS